MALTLVDTLSSTPAMARIFADACEKRGKNFKTVPKSIREEVAALIDENGYMILDNGKVVPKPEETEEEE